MNPNGAAELIVDFINRRGVATAQQISTGLGLKRSTTSKQLTKLIKGQCLDNVG